jgi:hypothetical protein
MNPFPTYTKNREIAEKGITFIKRIIENQFEWILRPTPLENDFGIDAHIDIVTEQHHVTGKYIGIQVKTGDSFFKNKKSNGWLFNGEIKHLNYYLNLNYPILIVIVNIRQEIAYWVEFDTDRILQNKNGWNITIPEEQKLDFSTKDILKNLAGDAIDYLPQLKSKWEIDKGIKNGDLIFYMVTKHEVENLNFTGLKILQKRLTANDDIISKSKGKMAFMIDGYDEDDRELYQIEEVRLWIKFALHEFKYWGYFLNLEPNFENLLDLRILLASSVEFNSLKIDNIYKIQFDKEDTVEFMNLLFHYLNEFCDKYKINDGINKERSYKIHKILFGDSLDKY